MTGFSADTPHPTGITVHTQSRVLQVAFVGGKQFSLPFEYLHVLSSSAEMQGHEPGQEVLQTDKCGVDIVGVEPVDDYAIRPLFSDGYDSGTFDWAYLYRFGIKHGTLQQAYLGCLTVAGVDRDAPMAENAGHARGHSH